MANGFLLLFGLTGIRVFTKLVECPKAVLIALIVVLSAVGAYAIQNNPLHVVWMLGFGVFGYFLKVDGIQVAPVVLGLIQGPMMDSNYRRAMLGARHDIGAFFWNFISNPISLVLSVALLTILVSQTPLRRWRPWTRNRGI